MNGVSPVQGAQGAAFRVAERGALEREVQRALEGVDPAAIQGEALRIVGLSDRFEAASARTSPALRIESPTSAAPVVSDLLDRNSGVYLGEEHPDPRLDRFVAENLESFVGAGVEVLAVHRADQRDPALLEAAEAAGVAVVPVRVETAAVPTEGGGSALGSDRVRRALAARPGGKLLVLGPGGDSRALPVLNPADPSRNPGPHYSLDGGPQVLRGEGRQFEFVHTEPFSDFAVDAADLWRTRGDEVQAQAYGRLADILLDGPESPAWTELPTRVSELRQTADSFDLPALEALQRSLTSFRR